MVRLLDLEPAFFFPSLNSMELADIYAYTWGGGNQRAGDVLNTSDV